MCEPNGPDGDVLSHGRKLDPLLGIGHVLQPLRQLVLHIVFSRSRILVPVHLVLSTDVTRLSSLGCLMLVETKIMINSRHSCRAGFMRKVLWKVSVSLSQPPLQHTAEVRSEYIMLPRLL